MPLNNTEESSEVQQKAVVKEIKAEAAETSKLEVKVGDPMERGIEKAK